MIGNPGPPILFFDGECGVCTRTVRFLLHRDKRRRSLRFASLQGNTARELLGAHPELADVDSLIWFDPPDATWGRDEDFGGGGGSGSVDAGPVGVSGRVQVRSDAVITAARYLGGVWGVLAGIAALVPRPMRDRAYELFARIRRRIPGFRTTCRLPTREEAARFLG